MNISPTINIRQNYYKRLRLNKNDFYYRNLSQKKQNYSRFYQNRNSILGIILYENIKKLIKVATSLSI